MPSLTIGKKDDIVMKLIHYFVTEENYRPIIVNGVQNEIWLENLESDIPLIRININYIHNEEQYKYDIRKADSIRKTIKKKTYSMKMNMLNLLVDVRDEVPDIESDKNIKTIKINKINDLKKNSFINEYFPNFNTKVQTKKSNMTDMFEMTDELNNKTVEEDKALAKVFRNNEKPIVTMMLIFINVIVYLLSLVDYNGILNNFANYYLYVQNGEYYRLITSMFVHANILHLVSNMYALYVVGPIIEKYYGKGKFLLIYLGSGIIGSLFSVVLTNYASVGASGAIFGLFGALLYFGYKYRATLDGFLRSSIIPTLLVNLLLGFMIPGIDVSAHLGGLIGGLLFSYQTGVVNKEKTKDKINGLIIILILIAFLIFMLIKKQ
mgnify:FL=1